MNLTHFPMGSEQDVQAWIAVEQKAEGNIGAETVVNPVLYKAIVSHVLHATHPVVMADFGAGTGSLAIDILETLPASKKALLLLGDDLLFARKNIRTIINVDIYESLLRAGKNIIAGKESVAKIEWIQNDLAIDPLPFDDHSIDLAVSRHFFMHLTHEELLHHLQEAYRTLKSGSTYLATILNPAYEVDQYARKNPTLPPLTPHQSYTYEAEHDGHRYEQISHYRPLDITLNTIRQGGFRVETEFLSASIPGYEEKYPRYYDETLPVSVLLKMRKEK